MKRLVLNIVLVVAVLAGAASQSGASPTYSWIPEGFVIYSDIALGTKLDGYQVTEVEYARTGRDGNTWEGDVWGGAGEVWLFGGDVWATFSTSSTVLAFEAIGDHNDGPTNFYVDNQLITTQDMHYFGGTLLVEGLEDIVHTVRVTGTTHLHGAYGLGPIDPDPPAGTPEPATLLLVGIGLIGLMKFRRKSAL